VASLLPQIPEWRLSSGHAHPDANSFIIWARGRYLTGDTGYSGLVSARQHNTITVGGVGQGVETNHDVWRELPYRTLANTRILSVDVAPSRIRIVADAAASYPEAAGLSRFTRTFTFEAPDRFRVEDAIALRAPRPIQSYLHADVPVRRDGARYQLGPADVWLDTTIDAPAGSTVSHGPTTMREPGRPGSIEQEAVTQRGFELQIVTPSLDAVRLRLDMRVMSLAPG
jgi:hypothetical protein